MMALLFPAYGLASSVFHVPFSISGVDRIAWIAGCLCSYAILALAPVAKMIRLRRWRLDALDIVGLTVLFFALWAYPRAVRWYCDRENAQRTDAWHWVTNDQTLYYFVEKNYPDTFSGMIEVYPPYFSLPKGQ
jgi:hypothetical protein